MSEPRQPESPVNTPHWSAWVVPVTAILLPLHTVRRFRGGMLAAWAVHLVGVAGGAVAIRAITFGTQPGSPENPAVLVAAVLIGLWDRLVAGPNLLREWIWLGMTWATVELLFLFAASILSTWDARPEPAIRTLGRAMRRLWIATPHLMAVLCAMTLALELANGWVGPRHPEEVETALVLLAWTWALVAALGVVGMGRWDPRCRWPAVCDACGYPVVGLPMSGGCPECGEPIEASIGPAARTRSVWEQAGDGPLQRWWRCVVDPIVRPSAFGRRLRVLWPERAHRWFFAGHAAVIMLMGPIGVSLMAWLDSGPWREPDWAEVFWTGVVVGLASLWGAVAAVLGLASLGTSTPGQPGAIPLGTAAIQAGCYLSGFVTLWALANWVLALASQLPPVVRLLDGIAEPLGGRVHPETIVALLFIVLNAGALVTMALLRQRIVAAARFANR